MLANCICPLITAYTLTSYWTTSWRAEFCGGPAWPRWWPWRPARRAGLGGCRRGGHGAGVRAVVVRVGGVEYDSDWLRHIPKLLWQTVWGEYV